ncbi:hypothetical protein [Flavobacterium sp.]|jgi:hypothetical protein|uniref:hypothetical protein n=1 Tax=Flavobacterium sp. TaxID=239 RepID=UPI0037BFFA55
MKSKILNFLLIIFSLFGYLEWSGNNHLFLFEAEIEIFSKLFTRPISVLHPFIVLPIAAQFILLFTLFQKKPSKKLTYISIFCLGILLGFMLIIGIISLNYKIALSTIPFIVVSIVTMLHHRKFKE